MSASVALETSFAPGLYRDMSFDEYAAIDAMNASTLKGFSRTPAHVFYELQHGGKERTRSLDLGWLLHVAVLEPARFGSDYVVPPRVDRRTKEGKATWAQFLAGNPGKEFIDDDTFRQVKAMAASVLSHETAGPFFTGRGHNEVSILWEDTEHGVRCKARIDRVGFVNEWPIVGDLKTAKSAMRRDFERAIVYYGYEVQAAHYLAGLETLVPVPLGNPFRRFVFFVVESEPPYLTAAYEIEDAALEGADQAKPVHPEVAGVSADEPMAGLSAWHRIRLATSVGVPGGRMTDVARGRSSRKDRMKWKTKSLRF